MLYSIILFLHIIGTVMLFVTFGVTIASLLSLRSCKNFTEARRLSKLALKADGTFPIGTLFVLLPGLYMTFFHWGWSHAWLNLSLALLVVLTIMGPLINLPRIKAIVQVADNATADTSFATMLEKIKNSVLWNSLFTMVMLTVAITYMMTVKPGLVGSIIATVLALIVGPIVVKMVVEKKAKA